MLDDTQIPIQNYDFYANLLHKNRNFPPIDLRKSITGFRSDRLDDCFFSLWVDVFIGLWVFAMSALRKACAMLAVNLQGFLLSTDLGFPINLSTYQPINLF